MIREDGPTMVPSHTTVEAILAALGHCLPLRVGQIRRVPHNEELALAGLTRAHKMPCPC